MAMHNKKALSGLVLFKTVQNNPEKHEKKENVWRRESWASERNSWDEEITGWTRERSVSVAQWLEHCVSSAKVVGSIPREHMYWQKMYNLNAL